MVGGAERARAADPPFFQRAGNRGDHRHFQGLGRGQRRQDAGQAAGQQAFPRAGRADHQQIVPAGRGDLERALGGLLALDLFEVRTEAGLFCFARTGLGQLLGALEVIEQADQVGRGDHGDPAGPGRFAALHRRADQAAILRAGMQRGEQHPGRGDDPPIERQFAHRDIVPQLLGIGHPHRRQQRQRDRQVIVRAFLGQVGGGQVDGDSLGRQR